MNEPVFRVPSCVEARKCLERFVNSAVGRQPTARISIPAQPGQDDDLLLLAYIDRAEESRQLLRVVRRYVARTQGLLDRDLARRLLDRIDALSRQVASARGESLDDIDHVTRVVLGRSDDGSETALEIRGGEGRSISGLPAEGWIVRREASGAETIARYPIDLHSLSVVPPSPEVEP